VDELDPDRAVRFEGDIAFGALLHVGPVSDDPDLAGIAALRHHWLVFDPDGRVAAVLPGSAGGTARTSRASWDLMAESRRFGWRITAHARGGDRPAATASPAVRPGAYRIELQPTSNRPLSLWLGLNWLNGSWKLRLHGQQIAEISQYTQWGYSVKLANQPGRKLPVELVTVLAVHCVLVEATRKMPGGG
jgi:hypothetical protein